jgi:hypothetical protein
MIPNQVSALSVASLRRIFSTISRLGDSKLAMQEHPLPRGQLNIEIGHSHAVA